MAPSNLAPVNVDMTKVKASKILTDMDSWPDAEIAIREALSTYMLEHTIVNGFTINPLTTTIENDINRIRQVAQGTNVHLEDVELYKRVLKQHNLVAIKLILLHLSPVLRDTMEHVQFASETGDS